MAMAPAHRELSRALLRFVAAALVTTSAALAFQDRIVSSLLPLFRAWLVVIDDTYLTMDLSVVKNHGESMLRRLSTPARTHALGKIVVRPDARTQLSNEAAAGIVLQPVILAIALLFAWPWSGARELALRFAIAAVPMLAVMLLDVPTMLYGFAWFEEIKSFEPERFSLLVSWADAMNAGGRFALTAVAVAMSVGFASALSRPRPLR